MKAVEMAGETADVKSDWLPNDLLPDILLRLPAKSIGRFRCVSKSWLSITTNPSFLFAHTSRSPHSLLTHYSCRFYNSFSFPNVNLHLLSPAPTPPDGRLVVSSALPVRRRSMSEVVFASCDGLICLCEKFATILEKDEDVPCYYLFYHSTGRRFIINPEKFPCYYVLNPLTGSRIDLPRPNWFPGDIMGLYFHPPTCEYRLILRIYSNHFNKVQLLTLGGEAWRTIESSPPGALDCSNASINLKGNLYWIVYNRSIEPGVLDFDTLEEEFKLLPMPPGDKHLYGSCCLIEIGESLGLSIVDNEMNSTYGLGIGIWFLKDNTWEKMHSVICSKRPGSINYRFSYFYDGIALFNKEELKVYFFGHTYVFRFDLHSKNYFIEEILDPRKLRSHSNFLYKESLVSYDSFRNR